MFQGLYLVYLIDTNILLFSFAQTEKLSTKVKHILQTEDAIFISMASFWEIEIKRNLGKLDIPFSPKELMNYCLEQNYSILNINIEHISELEKLPKIHNDPFDRLIICQAISENLTILTADAIIPKYPVKSIWK